METINIYIIKKIELIFKEISKSEFEIPLDRIGDLANIINLLDIETNNKNVLELHNYQNEKMHQINLKNHSSSYVLQYPPIIKNGKPVMIKPIIYITPFENKDVLSSTIYHELSHVFSIGKWQQAQNNIFEHISGIIKEEYVYENKIVRKQRKINDVNEEINDFVANFLYSNIENKKYSNNKILGNKKCTEYINCRINDILNGNIKKFIGYYFSNNIDIIEQILLSNKFDSLEDLNSFFQEIHFEQER